MTKFFINHTNHTSKLWSEEQRKAAEAYGPILDIPFPLIPPEFSTEQVHDMADDMERKIIEASPAAVLCQGEFTYGYALICRLCRRGIPVLAACSGRQVEERRMPDGTVKKTAFFRFVQFREF